MACRNGHLAPRTKFGRCRECTRAAQRRFHHRHKDRWQLDHIRPVSSFDLTDPAQQRACFHFSNFQPLWMPDNIRKGAKHQPEASP